MKLLRWSFEAIEGERRWGLQVVCFAGTSSSPCSTPSSPVSGWFAVCGTISTQLETFHQRRSLEFWNDINLHSLGTNDLQSEMITSVDSIWMTHRKKLPPTMTRRNRCYLDWLQLLGRSLGEISSTDDSDEMSLNAPDKSLARNCGRVLQLFWFVPLLFHYETKDWMSLKQRTAAKYCVI